MNRRSNLKQNIEGPVLYNVDVEKMRKKVLKKHENKRKTDPPTENQKIKFKREVSAILLRYGLSHRIYGKVD